MPIRFPVAVVVLSLLIPTQTLLASGKSKQAKKNKAAAPKVVTVTLPAPVLVDESQGTQLRWQPVTGATAYVIETCSDAACSQILSTQRVAAGESSIVSPDIPSFYWRVRAIGASEAQGTSSSALRRERTTISGKVFDDHGAAPASSHGLKSSVSLYADGGDGLANGADDRRLQTVETDSDGSYSIALPASGKFWIVVSAPHLQRDKVSAWAEQTWGPAGSLCTDDHLTAIERSTAGACFSGRSGDHSDDPSKLASSEHLARVTANGASLRDIDFGFSYDVVTTVKDFNHDQPAIQGSVRQFILNGQMIPGEHRMKFVPRVPPNQPPIPARTADIKKVTSKRSHPDEKMEPGDPPVIEEVSPWHVFVQEPLPPIREGIYFESNAFASDGVTPLAATIMRELFPKTHDWTHIPDLTVDLTPVYRDVTTKKK